MARGFGSTFGVNAGDKIRCGYATAAAAASSFYVRYWRNGAGGGNLGRLIDQNSLATASNVILFDNTASMAGTMAFNAGFSGGAGKWRWTAPGNGAWHSLVVTYDAASTANAPKVYSNGNLVSLTQESAPSGSFGATAANIHIGNRSDGARCWDGMIAEVAYWNDILGAAETAVLARGVPPLCLRPAKLQLYTPLLGAGSGEPDWSQNRNPQTITGTAARNHAPVSFWMPPAPASPPLAGFYGGALTLMQPGPAAAIAAHMATGLHPGRVTVGDAPRNRLTVGDFAAAAAPSDAALYHVQLEETPL
ncbi:MAG: LamG-like jellyroll fold domain-containing protein [Bdellovibrionales bacterium]